MIEQNCLELLRIIIHYLNYESNIAVFWKESKIKRDLSDGSKTGNDDSKKPRKGSSGSYTDEADIFEEGVESAHCRKVLFNCLKNLEEKNERSLHIS